MWRTYGVHTAAERSLLKSERINREENGFHWRANAFHDYVAYSFRLMMVTGAANVYTEQPCDSSAEEMAQKAAKSMGSNGGGSGGRGGVLVGGGC
ncbi:hypothetical protein D3C87_540890 [compost metagenome]